MQIGDIVNRDLRDLFNTSRTNYFMWAIAKYKHKDVLLTRTGKAKMKRREALCVSLWDVQPKG